MYKHLLVPIDDTPLTMLTVARAVDCSRAAGARITFFHAAPDLAATDDGALLYSMDNEAFADAQSAQGQAGLLQARTVADMAGVANQTLRRKTDHPARAIHDVALALGCDLIFLSAHGRTPSWRGVTQRLLEITRLPVLVACVESNQDDADMSRALSIISAEHRNMTAILRGMQQAVRAARQPGGTLDTVLLQQMIDYLRDFPATMHHPKEEQQLFRLLRLRSRGCEAALQELEADHAREPALVQAVADALARHDPGDASTLEPVADSVQRLAGELWDHMGLEESQVFPAAARQLLPQDWTEVAQAFTTPIDGLHDVDCGRPLAEAFARISATLLAAPPGRLSSRGAATMGGSNPPMTVRSGSTVAHPRGIPCQS